MVVLDVVLVRLVAPDPVVRARLAVVRAVRARAARAPLVARARAAARAVRARLAVVRAVRARAARAPLVARARAA
ncbi:hypothetical protein, partial [Candidatus Viridilinea mediisalina]|uniref:hypothetical protein n=1 Tax=Candidatus Viridilinea mediisalina TaxID=2024553 RepID=UPI001C2C4FAF